MAEHEDTGAPALTALETRALDWVVRTGSDAFEDWPAFHAWLEADPSHAAAYHAMALDIEEVAAAVPPVPVAPIDVRPARRRWASTCVRGAAHRDANSKYSLPMI